MNDFDQDGIEDKLDPNPKVFTYTAKNKGKRIKDGKPVVDNPSGYGTAEYNANQGIKPVGFLDIIGIDPTDAKQWFKFASTNPKYKKNYDSFKNNVARLGLPYSSHCNPDTLSILIFILFVWIKIIVLIFVVCFY